MKRVCLLFVLALAICTQCYAIEKPATTYVNLSQGKFYTFNIVTNPAYPDRWANEWCDGAKLTDESIGSVSWPLDEWVGWYSAQPYIVEVVLDLGNVREIDKIKLRTLSRQEYGIEFPDSVTFYTRQSTDDPWQQYGQTVNIQIESYYHYPAWIEQASGFRNVRYVKYELQGSGHMFVSEIEVWGNLLNSWKNVPDWGCYHGAYPSGTNHWMSIGTFENQIQQQSSMVLWYANMGASNFKDYLGSLWLSQYGLSYNIDYQGARYLEVGWEPEYQVTAEDIAGGYYDSYFKTFFQESIDYSNRNGNTDPVWLRPMSEMNGGWTFYPNAAAWGGDQLNFRRAWRRMFNIAEQVGAEEHHIFVWSPNGYTWGADHMPDTYYPGDQYVDWLGISVYPQGVNPYPENTLTGTSGTGSFDFYGTYGYKPIIISEGAYRLDEGVDGVKWINQWFDLPNNYPMVKAMIWFYIHDDATTNALAVEPYMSLFRQRVSEDYMLTQSIAGFMDIDKNHTVDFYDYAFLAGSWGQAVSNLVGDINGDNSVDIADIIIFIDEWLD